MSAATQFLLLLMGLAGAAVTLIGGLDDDWLTFVVGLVVALVSIVALLRGALDA